MPQTTDTSMRLPVQLRKRRGSAGAKRAVTRLLRRGALHTVCEEARCPNIGECFESKTATFMILGDTCTRRCHFCAVKTGRPSSVDRSEPENLAHAALDLGLEHVVITSVDRDDLEDCGARHFADCIQAVKKEARRRGQDVSVEILTPDFKGRPNLIDVVLDAQPDVFNHNIENVARLYKSVRPQSEWTVTSRLLRYVADSGHTAVKSGLMVGLGESDDEVFETLTHLRDLGVHIVTIGQYLRPSRAHWAVERYVSDEVFDAYRVFGESLGFTHVFSGPFVRSSYHAGEAHQKHLDQGAPQNSLVRDRSLPIV